MFAVGIHVIFNCFCISLHLHSYVRWGYLKMQLTEEIKISLHCVSFEAGLEQQNKKKEKSSQFDILTLIGYLNILPIYPSIHLFIYPFSIHSFIHLSMHPSFSFRHPSIYTFINTPSINLQVFCLWHLPGISEPLISLFIRLSLHAFLS